MTLASFTMLGQRIPQGGMHQEPRRGKVSLKFCAGNVAQPVDIGSGQGFQSFPEGSVARNEQLDMGKGRMRESLHQVGNALQLVNGSGKEAGRFRGRFSGKMVKGRFHAVFHAG